MLFGPLEKDDLLFFDILQIFHNSMIFTYVGSVEIKIRDSKQKRDLLILNIPDLNFFKNLKNLVLIFLLQFSSRSSLRAQSAVGVILLRIDERQIGFGLIVLQFGYHLFVVLGRALKFLQEEMHIGQVPQEIFSLGHLIINFRFLLFSLEEGEYRIADWSFSDFYILLGHNIDSPLQPGQHLVLQKLLELFFKIPDGLLIENLNRVLVLLSLGVQPFPIGFCPDVGLY